MRLRWDTGEDDGVYEVYECRETWLKGDKMDEELGKAAAKEQSAIFAFKWDEPSSQRSGIRCDEAVSVCRRQSRIPKRVKLMKIINVDFDLPDIKGSSRYLVRP